MEKSVEFNIKLNEKNKDGKTGCHLACQYGNTSIIDRMMENQIFLSLKIWQMMILMELDFS